MARHSSYGQAKQNALVKLTANSLRHKGWSVQADISGFEQPNPIGDKDRIPDIVARKRGAKK